MPARPGSQQTPNHKNWPSPKRPGARQRHGERACQGVHPIPTVRNVPLWRREIRAQTANNRIPRCRRPRRDDRLSGELPRRPAAVRVPSCSRPSRTLRAATRCPSGLLDRRRARRLWRPQVGTKKRFAQAEQRSDPRIKRCADLADSCAAMWTGLSPPLTVPPAKTSAPPITPQSHTYSSAT